MIGANADEAIPLSDLDPPFVAVEHHKGGHLPYGYTFDEYTVPEFWDEEQPTLSDLRPLYEESVRTAEQRFLDAIKELKERNILKKTLVIYTSDHGETFGEVKNGSSIGHGDPITPDLVNVPIVFAGAGLPNVDSDVLFSGTDIAPTALSALGDKVGEHIDGKDCWTGPLSNRLHRSEYWVRYELPWFGEINRYKATSVWDTDGGMVFHQGNRLAQLGLAVRLCLTKPWGYSNPNTPRSIKRWIGLVKTYGSKKLQYGNPKFTKAEAYSMTEQFQEATVEDGDAIDRDQLRNLGYLK